MCLNLLSEPRIWLHISSLLKGKNLNGLWFSGDEEKAKRDAGKWWKPWVSRPGGEHESCWKHHTHNTHGRVVMCTCPVLWSGEQLWLSPVWEWQWGGRGGGYGKERRRWTHKEKVCVPRETREKVNPMSLFVVTRISQDACCLQCCFSAGVQRLGHQLKEGSEGPEEREEWNKEGRKEENSERAAETAGWENNQEFALCLPEKDSNPTTWREQWLSLGIKS